MKIKNITSSSNDYFKYISKLKNNKNIRKYNECIVETLKLTFEALQFANIISFIFKKSIEQEAILFIKKYNLNNIDIYCLDDNLFNKLSGLENNDGYMCVINGNFNKENSDIYSFINNFNITSEKKYGFFILVLDRIQDPGNVGTLIRSAEAFNIDGIILLDSAFAYSLKTLRASMGSIFRVPVMEMSSNNFIEQLEILKKQKVNINVVSADMNGEDYKILKPLNDCLLIIGNEGSGISKELKDLTDKFIKINMFGDVESLNAGVSGSILMSEINYRRIYDTL